MSVVFDEGLICMSEMLKGWSDERGGLLLEWSLMRG